MPGRRVYKHAEIPNSAVEVDYTGGDVDLPFSTVGLFIGGAGDLAVDMMGEGSGIAISGIAAGTVLPGNFRTVNQSGSTATDIVCFYTVTHGS
jgi:hypothetical protein